MLTNAQQDEAIERFSLDEDDEQWDLWLESMDELTRDEVLKFVAGVLLPVPEEPETNAV